MPACIMAAEYLPAVSVGNNRRAPNWLAVEPFARRTGASWAERAMPAELAEGDLVQRLAFASCVRYTVMTLFLPGDQGSETYWRRQRASLRPRRRAATPLGYRG